MDRAKQELIELQSGQAEREARNRVTHAEEKVEYVEMLSLPSLS